MYLSPQQFYLSRTSFTAHGKYYTSADTTFAWKLFSIYFIIINIYNESNEKALNLILGVT